MRSDRGSPPPYPSDPTVPLKACPIATTLRSLGQRWTLTILRDIAFFPQAGFGLIRRRNPGLLARTLSLRLRQLEAEGLVRKVVPEENRRHPYYELTRQGLEIWPVLAALFQYGIQHHADRVFEDQRPRDLSDVYPHDVPLLLGPLAAYARSDGARAGASARTATAAALGRGPERR